MGLAWNVKWILLLLGAAEATPVAGLAKVAP